MVRAPHAQARMGRMDPGEGKALRGVLAVLTGADFREAGVKSIPHRPFSVSPPDARLQNRDGSEIFVAPHYPLPADKARFVGEAVAMVVAESVQLARDAAERVRVAYGPPASVTRAANAARPGRARLWEDRGRNV